VFLNIRIAAMGADQDWDWDQQINARHMREVQAKYTFILYPKAAELVLVLGSPG